MISVHKARFMGSFPHGRTHSYVIVGQDGGQSIPLDHGTLFLFSDTLLICADRKVAASHPDAPIPVPAGIQNVFLANCAAVASPNETTLLKTLKGLRYFHALDGLPKEILAPTDRERFRRLRFWPEHGLFLEGKVYFYYLGIQTTDSSSIWGFRTAGVGIASLDVLTGECRRFQHRGDWLYWRAGVEDLHFGVQVLRQEDFIYAFGSIRHGVENNAFLGRVRRDQITELGAYEYLASSRPSWTPHLDQASDLGPCGTEYSVSYNPYLQQYTMVYLDEYHKRLMMRTADELWGSYSAPLDLIGVPHQETSTLAYLGFEHAHFQQDDGRTIYVSYCEPHFAATSLLTVTLASQGPAAGCSTVHA